MSLEQGFQIVWTPMPPTSTIFKGPTHKNLSLELDINCTVKYLL